jgi:hypothetical protein
MPELLAALKKALSQPAFLVVAAVLLLAAVGLNGATQFMQLHFRKQAVPLAKPLTSMPPDLGPWKMASIDQTLSHEFLEALGTDKYLFRDYVDTRLLNRQQLAEFEGKSPAEQRQLISQIQMTNPKAVVNCSVTYYTGMVDTVAHIPERCYIADGYETTASVDLKMQALAACPGTGTVRSIVFEDSTPGRMRFTRNVAYVFNCNGRYMSDSIAVRQALAGLFEKYGYYMKIELQTLNLKPEDSKAVMNEFLTHLLPEAEKCLPDWQKIEKQGATAATPAVGAGS